MLIDNNKKEAPEFWLERRKWKEFLESVPVDGIGHGYFVQKRDDLLLIRVRASQINKDNERAGSLIRYKVSINLDASIISITVTTDEEEKKKKKKDVGTDNA